MNPNWNAEPVELHDADGGTWCIEWDADVEVDNVLFRVLGEKRYELVATTCAQGLNVGHPDAADFELPWDLLQTLHVRFVQRTMWVEEEA